MVYTKEQIEALENEEREKWMAAWEQEFNAEMEKDRTFRMNEKARYKDWTEDEFNEWVEDERDHFMSGDFDWNDHDENLFQQEYARLREYNHDDALERFADWFADKRASLETVD